VRTFGPLSPVRVSLPEPPVTFSMAANVSVPAFPVSWPPATERSTATLRVEVE
jgi:hypothetical protein